MAAHERRPKDISMERFVSQKGAEFKARVAIGNLNGFPDGIIRSILYGLSHLGGTGIKLGSCGGCSIGRTISTVTPCVEVENSWFPRPVGFRR